MMTNMLRQLRLSLTARAVPVVLSAFFLSACGGGSGGDVTTPVATPPPPSISKAQRDDAARFSSQATFGLPYAELDPIARGGNAQWLAQQFAQPVTYHRPVIADIVARRDAGEFDAFENDIEYLVFARRLAWWHTTVTADDALRQRVAFALSQIFVVSDNVDILEVYPNALGTYYDMLLERSFGNFRDLLRDVALSPAMGVYLSHLNNRRSDPINNTFPDENFAREVMQLFSIGLFELAPDGSVIVDNNGDPVPAYDNDDIREFAKIFTGFSFDGDNAFFGNRVAPRFDLPMRMFDAAHEPGEKLLLNGQVVPAGQTGLQDFEQAIDNLFNHPNVGPFIGRQLIQRLITSNPSADYVRRVAATFDDNGVGVRGDMQAVLRAVLLDAEARAAPDNNATFGKLREPVVRYAAILRQFGATSDDGFIATLGYFLQSTTRQHPLSSPSVFNFYLPTHSPAGELADQGLVAPEFEITDANTIIGFPNFVDAILFADYVTDAPPGFATVRLSLDDWLAIADDVPVLVDRLDTLMTHGTLLPESRRILIESLGELDDLNLRMRAALYWFLTIPEAAVRN